MITEKWYQKSENRKMILGKNYNRKMMKKMITEKLWQKNYHRRKWEHKNDKGKDDNRKSNNRKMITEKNYNR